MNETFPQRPEGQLSPDERSLLREAVLEMKPDHVIEVGTWLGGGSTLHILEALEENQNGHLWGIEAVPEIYEKMMANIKTYAPEAWPRFTPLLGKAEAMIPPWLEREKEGFEIQLAFLDGGDNPMEQISEFELIDPVMPVGSLLFAHDAKKRKGKWFVPYLKNLDHWETEVLDSSSVGLLRARKISSAPSPESLQNAKAALQSLRREPIEIIARLIPSPVCRFILSLTPKSIRNKLGQPHL